MSKYKPTVNPNLHTPCWGDPPIFRNDHDAMQWAIGQGALANEADATTAFTTFKQRFPVTTWAYWLGHVAGILAQQKKDAPIAQKAPEKAKSVAKPKSTRTRKNS